MMDAAVRRSDIGAISIRPCWVQWEGNYERNLGPQVRDPGLRSANFWSYIDVYDLADVIRLAVECELPGHEVCYIASPDNCTGRPLAELVRCYYGDRVPLRDLARPDASGISCAKAERLLGWRPTRSWRDYLDEQGHLRPGGADAAGRPGGPGPPVARPSGHESAHEGAVRRRGAIRCCRTAPPACGSWPCPCRTGRRRPRPA